MYIIPDMIDEKLKVAILIPTMNRADFVIRQLRYYASVDCPHTIYIGDSSNQENSDKIKDEVSRLKNKIKVVYKFLPGLTRGTADTAKYLLTIAEEKYSCYCCDDDYQIPNSLTKCAEFLENNIDYAIAGGHSVSFRIKNNGVYGELEYISNYPQPTISDEKASDRLIHFFRDNFVTLFFVNRTEDMLASHEYVSEIKDHMFSSEIVPCALSIIAGKSAILDCLGYIRQMHNSHRPQPGPSDWIHGQEWASSFNIYERTASMKVSQKDKIPVDEAVKIVRFAFSGQLLKWLSAEQRVYNANNAPSSPKNKNQYMPKEIVKYARSKVATAFPFLKYIYRMKLKPKLTGKKELNYEVLRPESKYYNDFKSILDSFTNNTN